MDEAGVNRAILNPPEWEGCNDLALEAAARYPARFAVMGRIALELPKSRELLADWRSQSGMLGVRLTYGGSRGTESFSNGVVDWFWPAAEEAGIPVMMLNPGIASLAEIATRHPNLKLIVDHAGMPGRPLYRSLDAAIDDVIALAAYENVAVKASALYSSVEEGYPFPSLHEPIRRLVAAFGAERVFWGTNVIYAPPTYTYKEAVELFTETVTGLSDVEREWIMGRALAKWLDWEIPDASWYGAS
jgi:predicted TIM-barrel fold metal-dependent hydrolase